MADLPPALARLVKALRRLPGVGTRSAERMMLHLMRPGQTWPLDLADAIRAARDTVRPCPECGFYSDTGGPCAICEDKSRDRSTLCVVETPQDVLAFERAGVYRGLYHCLGGKISPLDGVAPEDLSLPALIRRASCDETAEIILALGSDVEGETTTLYLLQELGHLGKRLTRLARGLALGTGLDSADPVTLAHALAERRPTKAG